MVSVDYLVVGWFFFLVEWNYFAHSVFQPFCSSGDAVGDQLLGLGRGDFMCGMGCRGKQALSFFI